MFVMTKLEKKKQTNSETVQQSLGSNCHWSSLVVKRSFVAACLKFLAGWNASDL